MKSDGSDKPGEGGSDEPFRPGPVKTVPFPDIMVSGDVKIAGDVKASDAIGNVVISGDAVGNVVISGDANFLRVSNLAEQKKDERTTKSRPGPAIRADQGSVAAGRDVVSRVVITGGNLSGVTIPAPKEVLSSEQALGRIADAVQLNLDQLQLNMEQARRESSQFFRTTMIFSGVGFAIILGGVGMMLGGLVTAGIVTTAASVIPQAGAALLFNKDKELRRTIETYHGHILESQRVLTMVDLAETMEQTTAKDSMKERIILAVLKVKPAKAS
jgi:hypothetical protein